MRARVDKAQTSRRAASAIAPPGRTPVRALLPSGRVAAFLRPNVGEFLALQEAAIANVQRALPDGQEAMASQVVHELTRLVLRKQLCGLTEHPVPSIMRKGFSEPAVRAEAEASLRAAIVEEMRAERGEDPEPADVDAAVAERLPMAVETILVAAEDVDAMCAAAPILPVNDWAWNEGMPYLKAMPLAELATPAAADWDALHKVAFGLATPVRPDPKASPTRLRPLRMSVAGS